MPDEDLLYRVGGDTGNFEAAMKRVISQAGGTIAAFAGFAGISGLLKQITEEALKDETATTALASAVKSLKSGTEEGFIALNRYAESMSLATGIAQTDLKGALTELTYATGSTTAAQKLLAGVIDVAKAKHRDLHTVALAVGKAYEGNTTMLQRFGIMLGKGKTSIEDINEALSKFGGAEDSYLGIAQGRLDKAKNSFNLLEQEIGQNFLPAIGSAADAVAKFIHSWSAEGQTESAIKAVNAAIAKDLADIAHAEKTAEIQKERTGQVDEGLTEKIKKLRQELENEYHDLKMLNGETDTYNKKIYEAVTAGQKEIDQNNIRAKQNAEVAALLKKQETQAKAEETAIGGITKAFNLLGTTIIKGDWAKASKTMLTDMTISFIDAFETITKAKLAADIAAAVGIVSPITAAAGAAAIPVDAMQIAGMEGLKGVAAALGGAASGLYADESMISTFSPREIVIPQRFSDLISSGKMALTGGSSTVNNSGGPVTIHIHDADTKSAKQIAVELAHYFKTERGSRFVRADGSMNI